MGNNKVCKYYEKINEEISRQVNPIVFAKHNCTFHYYDKKGNLVVIKSCVHIDSFEKCEHYESTSGIENK